MNVSDMSLIGNMDVRNSVAGAVGRASMFLAPTTPAQQPVIVTTVIKAAPNRPTALPQLSEALPSDEQANPINKKTITIPVNTWTSTAMEKTAPLREKVAAETKVYTAVAQKMGTDLLETGTSVAKNILGSLPSIRFS
jgi:hypothetical protein